MGFPSCKNLQINKKAIVLQSSVILLQCKSTDKQGFIQCYLFSSSKAGLRHFGRLSLRAAPLPITVLPRFFLFFFFLIEP